MAQLDIARTLLGIPLPDPDIHVGLHDTLVIYFHHSGTFYSPDPDKFHPALPDGSVFSEGQRWPTSGGANPKGACEAHYRFEKSSEGKKRKKPPKHGGMSGFHVIHVP